MKREMGKREEALTGEGRGKVIQRERKEGQIHKIKDA